HGVDEHEVALVQQAVVVRDHVVRRRPRGGRAVGLDAHRAERAHVQPQGRRAWAAVVQECHWPRAALATVLVHGVGGVEHTGLGLVLVIADDQRASGRFVFVAASANGDFVGGASLVLGGRRGGGLGGTGLGRRWRVFRLDGTKKGQREHAGQQRQDGVAHEFPLCNKKTALNYSQILIAMTVQKVPGAWAVETFE